MTRPKPRHFGHAPRGLLKENNPGDGGRMSRSQRGQCQPVENGMPSASGRAGSRKHTRPLPKRNAVSTDSVSRERVSGVSVTRSWMTRTLPDSDFSVTSSASSVRTTPRSPSHTRR